MYIPVYMRKGGASEGVRDRELEKKGQNQREKGPYPYLGVGVWLYMCTHTDLAFKAQLCSDFSLGKLLKKV